MEYKEREGKQYIRGDDMSSSGKEEKTSNKRNLIVTSFFASTGKSAQSLIESYILQQASNLL